MPLPTAAQSEQPAEFEDFSLSLAVSQEFLQNYLTAEYQGQDVSTEKDQAYGFENVRIRMKKGRVTMKTDFWYKKFVSETNTSTLLDVAGFLEASFTTVYLPEKKRIMLAKSSVERLKLSKGEHLKPLLIPLLRAAIDRVIVWKKIDHLVLGPYVKIPVKAVQIDLRDKGVLIHLNQASLIPKKLLEEMFVISATESTLNAALEKTVPHLFPEVLGEIQDDTGVGYEVRLSHTPTIDIYPGMAIGPGEMLFKLPLLFQPTDEEASPREPFYVTLVLQAIPHLEGAGKNIQVSLELKPEFQLILEGDSQDNPSWLEAAIQEHVTQIRTLLSELKVAIPPIQFIPEAQHMQLSKIVLNNNQMGVGATLVSEDG